LTLAGGKVEHLFSQAAEKLMGTSKLVERWHSSQLDPEPADRSVKNSA
jgi:hypothetical protein